jgi:hypothetical protein
MMLIFRDLEHLPEYLFLFVVMMRPVYQVSFLRTYGRPSIYQGGEETVACSFEAHRLWETETQNTVMWRAVGIHTLNFSTRRASGTQRNGSMEAWERIEVQEGTENGISAPSLHGSSKAVPGGPRRSLTLPQGLQAPGPSAFAPWQTHITLVC